jgi:hypothetical protein
MTSQEVLVRWNAVKSAIAAADKELTYLTAERQHIKEDLDKSLAELGVKSVEEAKASLDRLKEASEEGLRILEGLITSIGIKI